MGVDRTWQAFSRFSPKENHTRDLYQATVIAKLL